MPWVNAGIAKKIQRAFLRDKLIITLQVNIRYENIDLRVCRVIVKVNKFGNTLVPRSEAPAIHHTPYSTFSLQVSYQYYIHALLLQIE